MQLQNALSQIADIQRQMARTRTFRGYRAGTTLLTGIAAVAAALWQARTMPSPDQTPLAFVDLWVGVAIASLAIVGTEIVQRYRKSDSSLERELTISAIEQFLPSVVIGGLTALVICNSAPQEIWLLPGLWAIFFGLGLFASRRLLPVPIIYVAAFYALCGLGCIAFGGGKFALSPWLMGGTFGIGQSAAAVILYFSLERNHESQ